MPDRVVVFLDRQNVYKGAREMFCAYGAPHWEGQVDPVALARHLADDSPFSRQLHQVRIYRGQPDGTRDPARLRSKSPTARNLAAIAVCHPDHAASTVPVRMARQWYRRAAPGEGHRRPSGS
jgi:hypothetical protein